MLNVVNGRNQVWPGARAAGYIAHAQLPLGDRWEHLTNIQSHLVTSKKTLSTGLWQKFPTTVLHTSWGTQCDLSIRPMWIPGLRALVLGGVSCTPCFVSEYGQGRTSGSSPKPWAHAHACRIVITWSRGVHRFRVVDRELERDQHRITWDVTIAAPLYRGYGRRHVRVRIACVMQTPGSCQGMYNTIIIVTSRVCLINTPIS